MILNVGPNFPNVLFFSNIMIFWNFRVPPNFFKCQVFVFFSHVMIFQNFRLPLSFSYVSLFKHHDFLDFLKTCF